MNRIRRHTLIGAANKYNLTYTDNNAIFYKRRTANGAITENKPLKFKVDEVRGNSVVYNQSVNLGVTLRPDSHSSITDDIITLQCYANAALNQWNLSFNAKCVYNHKYYTAFDYIATKVFNFGGVYTSSHIVYEASENYRRKSILSVANYLPRGFYVNIPANNSPTTEDYISIKNIVVIDFTLMFGAGNEPATVEEFEAMFPLDYYEYNEGEIIPFAGQNLVSTMSDNTKHTLPLDPANWRDKQGNLVFPYGGMHGVGTAYDYAKVDADGYIRKAVRCFGQVDLGTLNWVRVTQQGQNSFFQANNLPATSAQSTVWGSAKSICNKYIKSGRFRDYGIDGNNYNKCHAVALYSVNIQDDSYLDASTFKTAMQGVPLIYELAEHIEIELATPIYVKGRAHSYGTEEITPENTQTPYTTPAHISIEYYSKK